MNRAKHFQAYSLDDESSAPSQVMGGEQQEVVEETVEDEVGIYELVRRYRGLREISEGQTRELVAFLHEFNLPMSALEGPKREIRTAVTAHVEPQFLEEFKAMAEKYGVSPSNLARLVLTGWLRSTQA